MKSVTTRVEKYIKSITSIVVVVNSTISRITIGTDDALSFCPLPPSRSQSKTFVSSSAISPLPSIRISLKIPSRMSSKPLLSSSLTTPSHSKSKTFNSKMTKV